MAESIELFDRKRRAYYRGWVIGFVLFTVFWVVRFGLKWAGIQSEILDWVLGIGFALVIPWQFYFLIKMNSLRGQAKNNPELNALLQDELVRYHELKAWKFGFIAMAACLGVFVVLSVFLDLKDTNAVVFTALWAGFGGYHLSFYSMERE
jgi:heme/copper-type cytochrome/quinol oxidase subunit 4